MIKGSLRISSKPHLWYVVLSLIYGTSLTIVAAPGEDISQARSGFINGEPSDFLGTAAGLFYSQIPNLPWGWFRNLTVLQFVLAIVSLNSLVPVKNASKRSIFAFLILHYVVSIFSVQQSRDGTLLAFTLCGLALLKKSLFALKRKVLIASSSICLLIFALSFRPALAPISCIFVIFLVRIYSRHRLGSLISFALVLANILIVLMPTILELKLSDELVAKRSFPVQTILIHDLGFAACQSASPTTADRAVEALRPLATDDGYANRICQYFRINTWQALVGFVQPTATTQNLVPPLNIARESGTYEKLRRGWVNTFVQDPKTLFQAKIVFLTQIVFSSQTQIYLSSTDRTSKTPVALLISAFTSLGNLIVVPWIILSRTYLLAPISLFLIAALLTYLQLRSGACRREVLLMPAAILLTFLTNSIFFVSDNARYVTPFALLSFVGLMICKFQDSEVK